MQCSFYIQAVYHSLEQILFLVTLTQVQSNMMAPVVFSGIITDLSCCKRDEAVPESLMLTFILNLVYFIPELPKKLRLEMASLSNSLYNVARCVTADIF